MPASVADVASTVNLGVTGLAFGGGLWWFWSRRQTFPKAALIHKLQCYSLSPNQTLVHLALTIENKGEVLLRIRSLESRIQQILPLEPSMSAVIEAETESNELPWPLVQ